MWENSEALQLIPMNHEITIEFSQDNLNSVQVKYRGEFLWVRSM